MTKSRPNWIADRPSVKIPHAAIIQNPTMGANETDNQTSLKPNDFSLEEYLRLIFDEKSIILPEQEEKNLNFASKLLDKQNELKAVHEDLTNRKEEFRVKMQLTEMRRRRLEEKECELKESLMKFEKFLKDNDDKRARALKKLSLERGIQKQRLKQIDELNERIQKLTRERKNLDTKVKRLRIFKDFLEQVVKRSDDFNDISELMKRYESLTANLSDLMEKEEMNSDMSQNLEIGLHKYREDKCDEKMFLLNKLTELRRSLELHQIECRDNQVALEHEKDATVWRIIQLNSIKLAIQNMYQLARKFQRFGSEANADDTKSQLSVIASFILDLSLIVKNLSGQASTLVS